MGSTSSVAVTSKKLGLVWLSPFPEGFPLFFLPSGVLPGGSFTILTTPTVRGLFFFLPQFLLPFFLPSFFSQIFLRGNKWLRWGFPWWEPHLTFSQPPLGFFELPPPIELLFTNLWPQALWVSFLAAIPRAPLGFTETHLFFLGTWATVFPWYLFLFFPLWDDFFGNALPQVRYPAFLKFLQFFFFADPCLFLKVDSLLALLELSPPAPSFFPLIVPSSTLTQPLSCLQHGVLSSFGPHEFLDVIVSLSRFDVSFFPESYFFSTKVAVALIDLLSFFPNPFLPHCDEGPFFQLSLLAPT